MYLGSTSHSANKGIAITEVMTKSDFSLSVQFLKSIFKWICEFLCDLLCSKNHLFPSPDLISF